jgi:paraquat-inducible protein A
MSEASKYLMCNVCSNHVLLPEGAREALQCDRCGHKFKKTEAESLQLTWAFALTALIFYVPANIFPFMTIELYGKTNTSTIWGGILSLFESGAWTVALIVFLASIVIPAMKLVILFYLAFTARTRRNSRFKTKLYYFVEAIGRWSMLDIFLLAVLVAIVKLAPMATVQPEFGSLMFAMVVIFTMLASANFDPKFLWSPENEEKSDE